MFDWVLNTPLDIIQLASFSKQQINKNILGITEDGINEILDSVIFFVLHIYLFFETFLCAIMKEIFFTVYQVNYELCTYYENKKHFLQMRVLFLGLFGKLWLAFLIFQCYAYCFRTRRGLG